MASFRKTLSNLNIQTRALMHFVICYEKIILNSALWHQIPTLNWPYLSNTHQQMAVAVAYELLTILLDKYTKYNALAICKIKCNTNAVNNQSKSAGTLHTINMNWVINKIQFVAFSFSLLNSMWDCANKTLQIYLVKYLSWWQFTSILLSATTSLFQFVIIAVNHIV